MEHSTININNPRIKISVLWLFILFNIIFRDIHQMTLKTHLEMLLTGYFNGMKITDTIMLFGAFVVNIPISMLLVSILGRYKISRTLNVVSASLMPFILLTSPPTDLDDIFHLIVEITAIITIIVTAFKWKTKTQEA
jgi:hypothetical protein